MLPTEPFIAWLESKGLRPKTIAQYKRCLENLQDFKKFNQESIDRYIGKFTSNVARAFLRNYKEFLLRNPKDLGLTEDQVHRLRELDIPKRKGKKRPIPKPLSEDQVWLIEKEMRTEAEKVMLLLSFYCALRRHELLNITFNDINWAQWKQDPIKPGILKLTGKGGKKDIIPIKPEIMHRLRNWINSFFKKEEFDKSVPLFVYGVGHDARKWFYRLEVASKKAIGEAINPHRLRHAMAMHLRNNLGWSIDEIKEFLRHEDISTTQIYSRVSKEKILQKYSATV